MKKKKWIRVVTRTVSIYIHVQINNFQPQMMPKKTQYTIKTLCGRWPLPWSVGMNTSRLPELRLITWVILLQKKVYNPEFISFRETGSKDIHIRNSDYCTRQLKMSSRLTSCICKVFRGIASVEMNITLYITIAIFKIFQK